MEYLTVKEAAEFLKISPWTLYRYCQNKEIPFSKKKGRLRFKLEELEQWVDEGNVKPFGILEKNFKKVLKDLTKQPLSAIINLEDEKAVMAKVKSKDRFNFPYGSIYQRTPGGRWTIDYRKDGKRYQQVIKEATSPEDAHEALWRKKFSTKNEVENETQPIAFKDYAEIFMRNYSRPNKRSWKCDEYALEAHLKPFFGRLTLNEITPLLIEEFRSEKLKAGLARSSTNRLLALLKKMFSVADTWDFVDGNPVKAVKLFSEKDNRKERILSEAEESRLLKENAVDHLKPIIITALISGMRKAEILNLNWNQIDMKQRLIKVQKTKSGEDREIPINDVLLKVLKKQRNGNGNGYVFANPKTGEPFRTVRHSFENACRRAGIKNLRFHDLRHTFACRLIQRGCDIETLRSLLGHHSITVTERYIHTDRDQKRKAVNLLVNESKTVRRGDKMVTKIQASSVTPSFSVN